MRSAQRQVELRRLCNQLTVLCKANSLCKIVKVCVLCLFLPSPGHVWPGIKGALYRIWCGVLRLGDSVVKVV